MIDPQKETDLIKKACVKWLKNQMKEIIRINIPEQYDDIISK